MEKAQWSPINSEHTLTGNTTATKKPHPGLTRLPINFSNGAPSARPTKQYSEPPKKPPVLNILTPTRDLSTPEAEARSSKPPEVRLTGVQILNKTGSSAPFTTDSANDHTSERRVQGKTQDMASNGRNTVSVASSMTGIQTPKAIPQSATPTETRRAEPQKPNTEQEASKVYQAFNIAPPRNDLIMGEKQFNTIQTSESRRSSVKRTPAPRETPASFSKGSPNELSAEPHEIHTEPVQDGAPHETDEQSSSSSDDETAHLPTVAGRKAEEAIEEAAEEAVEEVKSPSMDEPDQVATTNSLPDDHPTEWLVEAREFYKDSLPPFVTKQKSGVRRMVELPLVQGRQYAGKIEVVYRSWDVVYSFASIDKDGKRFIVKVFRGGATPYRPWLGPRTGFSETALAFSKQVPRGPKAWEATQEKRVSLPKGWALKEDDAKDDDYNPANRRKSVSVRRQRRLNYDLNEDEEELDEDPDQEDPYQIAKQIHSARSLIEGDYAAHDPNGDQPISTTQPPSKLINAVKKSLRLPKDQDVFQRPKQIKRRSIGGQGVSPDSGENKRQKNKAIFSSDSEHSVPHKRAKATKAIPQPSSSTGSANPKNVSQALDYELSTLDAHTLSPYKQAYTTLRIALDPYPQKSAIYRLRSCMTMGTFFSSVIGVSGYKGDKDRIFGITATFDCKSDDDADKSMVIREEWQDSFDVFLETVDGAESWTEEGGKCGVAVSLLLTEG